MKRFISKLLTVVMMASIIMNTIYASANAKEIVTTKVKEKPHYQRLYDFNKQRKAVDNSSKEVSKNEVVETEVVDNNSSATVEVDNSTSYSNNNENIVLNIPQGHNVPTELRTIETSDSIVLIWNSVANGKGYELEVDGEIKDCGNKTLFVHSNIKDSNTHKYRVRAKNGELKSEWSSYVEKSKKLEIIDVPENIINVPGENSIKISWNRVNSATSYDIEVDGVIKEAGKSTNYIHEALEPNTKHTYKVRAKKDDNYGEWSKVITVSTLVKNDNTNKDIENKSNTKIVNEKDEKAVVKELKDSNTSEVVTKTATQTTSSASRNTLAAATTTAEVQVSNTLGVEDVILTLPLNIKVEPTNSTLLVHWDKVEGAKGYDIEVDGKTIVGSTDIFYQNINLLSGTQHTYRVRAKDDTKTGEWSEVITGTTLAEDIIVKSSITLTSDRIVSSLNLTAGTLSLNGFKLTVVGNLVQSGGTINIAGGNLIVENNITQTGGTMNINKGKLTVKSNYKITGNSYLSMPDAACYALVEGDFEISSNYDGYNYLKAGTLEVKGNLTQKSLNYGTNSKCNFRQDVGFVVKLSGGTSQVIDIMDDTSSSFNILDISMNPKVIFIKPIRAKEIRGLDKLGIEDMLEIVGTWNPLSNNLVVGGSIKLVSGTINLNGHDLTILGDLTQIDTRLNLTSGKLIVGKDYKITGNSYLNMIDAACYVLVEGNFEISSNYDGYSYFKAGTLEVKGNLTQKSLNYNTSSKCNFNQNIGFNLKLSGGIGQTIDIMDDTSSSFNILDISMNPKAIFIKPIRAKEIRGLDKLAIEDVLEIVGTWNPLSNNLVVGGSIKLVSGTIKLNGKDLTILGDLTQIDTRLNLTGGKLIVGNDYKITGNSYLSMLDAACYVLVEGNFEISSNYDGYSYFKAGTLEIKGNLTQKSLENSSTDDKYNFRQNVGFVIKLSGKNGQIVNITNYEYCSFNMLDMSESNGVIFLSNIGAMKILGWEKISGTNFTIYNSNLTFDRNEIINCNLELLSGSLNLNGYSLVALKNLTQSSNQSKINGGQLIIGQDYIINGNSRLIMTNSNDYVLVTGNFDTKSRSSENGYLSAGILEVKGNLTEGGYSEYSLCQTELFTLKLTGDSIQTVKIVSGSSSKFSILDMSLSAGVIISSGIKAFMITGLDKIRNDYSLSLIDTNITLFGDTTLNCGLDLNGGSLDLNGNDFNVEGSLSETNSRVILNGGHLKIKENYFIEGSSLLVMQNPYDIVVVGGSFITSSSISESGYLTTGILILKGDFSQSGNSYSFDATGDHYVVFNGTILQHVSFEDKETSKFNDILIRNPVGIDYSKSGPLDNDTIKSLEKLSELAKILDAKAVTIVKAFIEKEKYGDILEIALKWKNENPGSLMTEAEANAMIIEYEGGKSIDEILEAIKKARNAYLAAFGDQAPIIAIGNFAIDDIRMINGRPYGKMKQVLDCLFDVVGTDPSTLNYFQTTWNVGKSGVDFYTVHVINPNTGVSIVKIYNPTDAILNDADNGDPYCDILKIISDLGLSSKLEIGYLEECSSYVIYVDVKQHYLEITASIAAFLEKHQVDIDAFCFATAELGEPINLALQSIKLNMQGIKSLVALESLAKLSGKTLPEVMKSIKVGMPLLEKAAEAVSKLKYTLKYSIDELAFQIKKVVSLGDEAVVDLGNGITYAIREADDVAEAARPAYREVIQGIWKYSGKTADEIAEFYFSKVANKTKLSDKFSGSASEILRAELKDAGVITPPYKNQAHHIIPAGDGRFPATGELREIIDEFGVDINSASNGVFLPDKAGYPHAGNAAVHNGSHTEAYYKYVLKKMTDANLRSADDVVEVLNKIRKELLNGTISPNM